MNSNGLLQELYTAFMAAADRRPADDRGGGGGLLLAIIQAAVQIQTSRLPQS